MACQWHALLSCFLLRAGMSSLARNWGCKNMCYIEFMSTPRTVTISLPPELARRVDRVARAEGRSRSELFREALRQYLERGERWDRIFSFGEKQAGRLGLKEADVSRAVKAGRRARSR